MGTPLESVPETAVPAPAAASGPVRTCPDCEHPAPERYCPHCGQRQGPLHVSLLELFHDWVDEFLHFDSKLMHTLGPLLYRPGFLTREYIQGRRTRYLRPFRLWFTVTVAYFVLVSLVPAAAATGQIHVEPNPGETAETAPPAPPLDANHPSSWTANLGAHFKRLEHEDQTVISRRLQKTTADYGPHLILILVPIFALLLKLFYRRTPLGEHFVFSFHLHAFHAIAAGVVLLAECSKSIRENHPFLQLAPFAALALYQLLALRRVQMQGWIRTFFKSVALGIAYLMSWALLQGALLILTALQT